MNILAYLPGSCFLLFPCYYGWQQSLKCFQTAVTILSSNVNSFWKTFWQGANSTVKWTAIQYLTYFYIELIGLACMYIYSLKTGITMRQLMISKPFENGGLDDFDYTLIFGIQFYTPLFAFWQAFFSMGKRWTFIFPWIIWMTIMLLIAAGEQYWCFRGIMKEDYLLGAWLAPLFGIVLQILFILTRKWVQKKQSQPLKN